VKDDNNPYLAYSPLISIEDSSEPFRAFLGAILSIVEDVPVERSPFNPNMQLDVIKKNQTTPHPKILTMVRENIAVFQAEWPPPATQTPVVRHRTRILTLN
jgi:hypothetical protein